MIMTDEEQIRALVDTWMRATKAGDIDTVLELMTDDVVFLMAGQPPMIGKAAFAAAARGPQRPQFDGKSEIQEICLLGEWAYMWNRLEVTVTSQPGAAPSKRAGPTLTILRKENGHWLLARDANMLSSVPT